MNFKIIFSSLLVLVLLQSCATTKNKPNDTTIFWVSGYKTEAVAGAGKMQVLNIHRGTNLDQPQWENFYANIEGFQFEEGYLQKIEVSTTQLDKTRLPADASSIKYSLVKVLDKQKDLRTELDGSWTLAQLNDHPLNRMVVVPKLNIDLSQKLIYGNGGCNEFTSKLQNLGVSKIELGPVASTQKACINKNVEAEFNQALNSVKTYQIKGNTVTFYDEAGKKVLAFIKDENKAPAGLNGSWVVARIDGNPVNRMDPAPKMELNLTSMQVAGNNSCNEYSGKIARVTSSALQFGPIAATNKMCRSMETADRFNQAINKAATFKLEGSNLTIYNEGGDEIITFLKVD